jgi:hypothetical protein
MIFSTTCAREKRARGRRGSCGPVCGAAWGASHHAIELDHIHLLVDGPVGRWGGHEPELAAAVWHTEMRGLTERGGINSQGGGICLTLPLILPIVTRTLTPHPNPNQGEREAEEPVNATN